jgi:hypothetical protein
MNSILSKLGPYAEARLKELSTWQGIVVLLTLGGVSLSPNMKEFIITLGLLIFGGVGAVLPDKIKKEGNQDVNGSNGST